MKTMLNNNVMDQVNGGKLYFKLGSDEDPCPAATGKDKRHRCNRIGHREEHTWLWMTQGYDIYQCAFCNKILEEET